MNEFKNAKEAYGSVPIPEELDGLVRQAIRQGRNNCRKRSLRQGLTAAAACFALLVGVLNVSPAAAAAAAEIPVLGGLFQILTVRDYTQTVDGIHYQVSVPAVQAEGGLSQQVNDVIQAQVDAHLAKAKQDWEDYREAFFATGGSEEEWGDREMDVIVEYEIKSQTDSRVSFVVSLGEGWVSSFEERYYYNLDLAENRAITLEMILGKDWIEICNEAVRRGIADSVDEEGFTLFFAPEEGGFVTVDENTTFYIREDGTPVVTFPRYSIAAGAAGSPEFAVEIAA